MNYGKKSTAKKRTALISRSSMMGKRARVSFIRVLFVSLIALCIIVEKGCIAQWHNINIINIRSSINYTPE